MQAASSTLGTNIGAWRQYETRTSPNEFTPDQQGLSENEAVPQSMAASEQTAHVGASHGVTAIAEPTKSQVPGSGSASYEKCSARQPKSIHVGGDTYQLTTTRDEYNLGTRLLLLMSAFGHSVSKCLLRRLTRSHEGFDEEVGKEDVFHVMRVHADVDFVLDQIVLEATIEHLVSQCRIRLEGTNYVCSDEDIPDLLQHSRQYWIRQAFLLCLRVLACRDDVDNV